MADSETYDAPVASLLERGWPEEGRFPENWPDYRAHYGLDEAAIPALIRMAGNRERHLAERAPPAVHASVHAWRALAQLGAVQAAETLADLAVADPDDDWAREELPEVFACLGPAVLPVLLQGLGDETLDTWGRITLSVAVKRIGEVHSDHAGRCTAEIAAQLARHHRQEPSLNAFLVDALVELDATDAIDVVRDAFDAGRVDTMVRGDLEDVEIDMGLRRTRTTPRPRGGWMLSYMGARQAVDGLMANAAKPAPWPEPARRPHPKLGRNDACPCGSGRKAKKCCGAG